VPILPTVDHYLKSADFYINSAYRAAMLLNNAFEAGDEAEQERLGNKIETPNFKKSNPLPPTIGAPLTAYIETIYSNYLMALANA
jgi:hypothetical protein